MSSKKRKGGRWCSAPYCRNNSNVNKDLSFFRFPKDDDRAKKWILNSGRGDLLNKDAKYVHMNCTICSVHFEDVMFANFLKNRLKPDAVPTLFITLDNPESVSVKISPKERTGKIGPVPNKAEFGIQKRGHARKKLRKDDDDDSSESDKMDAVAQQILLNPPDVVIKEETIVKEEVESDPDTDRPHEFEFVSVKKEPEEYTDGSTSPATEESSEQMGQDQERPLIIKEEIDCDDYVDPFRISEEGY